MVNNKKVKSFWGDGQFSDLEKMCVRSFLFHGFEYELYVYNRPQHKNHVPDGVTLKDASDVLGRSKVFYYQSGFNSGSISGFSNLFRYMILYKEGGIWVDTDLCLLDDNLGFNSENVFVKEGSDKGKFASCLIKARKKNTVLRKCLDRFNGINLKHLKHGETGPELVTEMVHDTSLNFMDVELKKSDQYFPIMWDDIEKVFNEDISIDDDCKTIHFWNSWLREKNIDKNGSYPEYSLYEKLKNKYLN